MTPWSKSVGFLPWKVTVYEEPARKGVLYLRWRQGGNWKRKSLRRPLRTKRGTIDPATRQWAEAQAAAEYARLVRGVPAAERAPAAPMTIAQGLAAAIDATTGKYPVDTMHRREVVREMERAIQWWGADTPWEAIKKADLRRLWRARIHELAAAETARDGLLGAEVTVSRILTVARWLRSEELIGAGACVAPETWRDELRADWMLLRDESHEPEPFQPRYTLDEMRRYLKAALTVDPRHALLAGLGAELRPGQVRRCRRSDLDLDAATLTVWGRGHKKGTVVKLTAGQLRQAKEALATGYLRELERTAADYPLFPSGKLAGSQRALWKDPEAGVRTSKGYTTPTAVAGRHDTAEPVDRTAIRKWHRLAEAAAEIPYVKGRGMYALRRAGVDAAKALGISREGLKAHGGWTDTQVPDRIYADQDAIYAQDEARDIRAKIRGEEAE